MRCFCALTLLLFVEVSTSQAALVGHWSLDDAVSSPTAVDSVGPNSGAVGVGTSFGAAGVSGTAATFTNAANSSIIIPSTLLSGLANGSNTTLSISMWINPSSFGAYKTIYDTPSREWSLWINSPSDGFWGVGALSGGGNSYSPNWTTGEWQHLVATFNGPANTLTVYRDSLQDAVNVAVGSSFSKPLTIGNNPSGGGSPFVGLIDDIQVYDNVLTQTQINYLFANPGYSVPEPSSFVLAMVSAVGFLANARRVRKRGRA